MSKVITGAVGAMNILAGGREIGDATSVTLPDIERPTTEIKGAGIMGTFAMPISGQVNAMTASVAPTRTSGIWWATTSTWKSGSLSTAAPVTELCLSPAQKFFYADTRQRSAAERPSPGARGMRRTITRSCATVRSWTVRKRCWSTRSPAVLSSVERISWVGSAGLLNKEDLYGRKPYNG